MPGEAQKIERLMEVFSRRYCACNPEVARLVLSCCMSKILLKNNVNLCRVSFESA